MRNYNLGFISNIDLYNHVRETVLKYIENRGQTDVHRNLIDPIKLSFDGIVYRKTFDELMDIEAIRQISESNNNQIGYFNQDIFRYIGTECGWRVPPKGYGYDIENRQLNYFVEMKNKHNTMNSSSSSDTYMKMQHTIRENPAATCFLVEVIALKSQNVPWKIRSEPVSDERIRRVSIDKFYELVTGNPIAFRLLCEQLPYAIIDVFGDLYPTAPSPRIDDLSCLRNLYFKSFSQYEGFHTHHV